MESFSSLSRGISNGGQTFQDDGAVADDLASVLFFAFPERLFSVQGMTDMDKKQKIQ